MGFGRRLTTRWRRPWQIRAYHNGLREAQLASYLRTLVDDTELVLQVNAQLTRPGCMTPIGTPVDQLSE
jgi:hypothetical protein